jgi:hypothetical protein
VTRFGGAGGGIEREARIAFSRRATPVLLHRATRRCARVRLDEAEGMGLTEILMSTFAG